MHGWLPAVLLVVPLMTAASSGGTQGPLFVLAAAVYQPGAAAGVAFPQE